MILPGRTGAIGAWLMAGPLRATREKTRFLPIDSMIADVRDADVKIERGFEVTRGMPLRVVASSEPHIDLITNLRAPETECFALAAAILRATTATHVLLVLGVDDGVAVSLDGHQVYVRDLSRPIRHDDDTVRLDLAPGDHALVIRLHQRIGRWSFRARLLDPRDLLPPRNVAFVLPGVSRVDAAELATSMARVDVDLGLGPDGYRPVLNFEYAAGAPALVRPEVTVKALGARDTGETSRFYDVALGQVPWTDRSTLDFRVALPAVLAQDIRNIENDGRIEFHVEFAGQEVKLVRPVRTAVRTTVARIDQMLAGVPDTLVDRDVVQATLVHQRERLAGFIGSGDKDTAATVDEAAQVDRFLDQLAAGRDPLQTLRGASRLAYRSPLDERTHPFGLYVPPAFDWGKDRKWPLVVVLHGLNGKPMQMIRWFFGGDDPNQNGAWEDRHLGRLADLDAFVVSPSGFGSLGYRDAGEVDVMFLRDWVTRVYPIDPSRVYVTGPSMGGIGTASVAFRYPDRFAAAAPLCGYHSYFLRGDVGGKWLRPWERSLAEFWSNSAWAENGLHTPLYVVHGKRDLPQENSGVLIDRYKQLGYVIEDEHPDEGHDVWQKAYEDFKTYRWLARHRRDLQPKRVVLKTGSLRYADNAWVHVTSLHDQLSWGVVDATVRSKTEIGLRTTGIDALVLDRPDRRVDVRASITVKVDGTTLQYDVDEPIAMARRAGKWSKGSAFEVNGIMKRRGLSGPIHDLFFEPLVVVVGTRDPSLTRANYEVAQAFADPAAGVEAKWPIVADVDLDEATEASHALLLVGNARSNAYVASINDRLPIRIDGDAVVVGDRRMSGSELGTMFIYPNPKHPEHYVVVVESVDVAGTLRALSLPRLLPDFVVYDQAVATARGQMVLGSAALLAAGFFDGQWRLPVEISDPGRARAAGAP